MIQNFVVMRIFDKPIQKFWVTSEVESGNHNFRISVFLYRDKDIKKYPYFWTNDPGSADKFTSDEIDLIENTVRIQYPKIQIERRRL
jgi:hypothetical protein